MSDPHGIPADVGAAGGDAAHRAGDAEADSSASPSRRLHPATLVSRWVRIVPQMLGGGAAYGLATAREAPGRILFFILIAGLIGAGLALLVWWRFRYTVGEGEIVIESGILRRQRRVIPYDRVQDVSIERRLLARLFGTAKVRIETGGASADEGDLDMIALADAHALRDRIRRRKIPPPQAEGDRAQHGGGAGTVSSLEESQPESDPVLFELSFGQLLYSGLFNFSLLFLAVVFAIVQNLDDVGFLDIGDWLTSGGADAAAATFSLRLALVLVPLLLLLGMVSGVARTVARDFGFRLTRSGAGFRRRRGLFTLTEVVIPVRRTQVAVIDSGPVMRWLGWYRLSFQTLGADLKEGGVQVAAPFARMEALLPILAEAGFPVPPPHSRFHHAPRRALVRWAGPWLVLAAVGVAAALVVEPWAGAAAALLALASIHGLLRWRKHGYALDSRALFVSRGLLSRRLSIIPFERAQTILVWRGPLQRRLRLASLLVDTAGGSPISAPEVVDLDSGRADALGADLLARFHAARTHPGRKLRASP